MATRTSGPAGANVPARAAVERDRQRILRMIGQHRLEDAGRLCEKLCKRNPGDVDALLLMASIHANTGNLDAVAECCQRVLAHEPGNEAALYNLAVAASSLGRLQQAETVYRELLRHHPSNAAALSNLGAILNDRGAVDESVQLLEKAVAATPGDAPAWFRLGQASFSRSQAERAISCFRKALAIQPDFHDARYALATVLSATGGYDEALALYEQLLGVQPENSALIAAIGSLFEFRGDKKQARDYLRPWLGKRPSLEIAGVYARCVDDDSGRKEAVNILRTLLATPDRHPQAQRRDALYALGDLYDRLCDYDLAFETYAQANGLERHVLDMKAIEKEFAGLHESLAPADYPGNPSTRPVFVIGMPRSGTTLVEQILASHSRIHGAGELDAMARLVNRVRRRCGEQRSYLRCLPALGAEFLDALATDYLSALDTHDTGASRVIDKMPHNFLALGLISVLFPQARVIHCRRDPRDTCLSIYFQHFTGNHPYTSDLYALGRYFRLYQGLMDHWKAVLPLSMLEIDYRDVVLKPEESARRLVEFCDLAWEPQCLEFHRNERLVTTPTYSDVRQPVYRRSLERWKHYEHHIDKLLSGLGVDLLP